MSRVWRHPGAPPTGVLGYVGGRSNRVVQDVVVQVRPANPWDVDDIRLVDLASWRAAYQGLLAADVLEVEATIRAEFDWISEIRSGSSRVEVAVDDREIVGVVLASAPPGGTRDLPEI